MTPVGATPTLPTNINLTSMDSIKSGSQEHLKTFANTKLKNYFENKWDQEINVLLETAELRKQEQKFAVDNPIFEKKLADIEGLIADTNAKLASKQYASANEGKQVLQKLEQEKQRIEGEKKAAEENITALKNMIIRDTETIANHKSVIEKTQQWVEDNGTTE